MAHIVDPSPWLDQEIAELDRRYEHELGPLRAAVHQAKNRHERAEAKALLRPVQERYDAERMAIEVRRTFPW